MSVESFSFRSLRSFCAVCGLVAVAGLSACTTPPPPPPPLPEPSAPHQVTANQATFYTLPNIPAERTPVRIGVVLPFSDPSAYNRQLAAAMMNAMTLALYQSGNRDAVLMMADDAGPGPGNSAETAVQGLLDKGAEIVIGPIFAPSALAAAPLARDRGVPVIAFSTDRSVAGNGVYLLSFQLQNEVERIVSFAVAKGHRKFAALIPQTSYGEAVEQSFRAALSSAAKGVQLTALEHYSPSTGTVSDPAALVAKSGADTIFLPQGGSLLRALVPTLTYNGVDATKVKYIGTGLWDDPANTKEPQLTGGWFAAPQPSTDAAFAARYRSVFGNEPPSLAGLAYDAVSLTTLLAKGMPYHRFTKAALTDPNGFAGAGGIFRFRANGSIDRGLAVLEVTPDGFKVISPAPATFQKP